ncbi:MAG: epoxyqueuosine reductase QueH [Ruminococcaceae bacterium]|nr:epoxyqueuosine reductase QueH [Oscillospiraceae bacterium]
MKQNYSICLENTIKDLCEKKERKTLLLHACCAPCSSYVLEYLSQYFDITLFFFNPNIAPEEEYRFREQELRRLIGDMPLPSKVKLLSGRYDPNEFYEIARGKEELDEGGARCYDCYRLRLRETAQKAKELGFDYFCTTLSISPYKNAEWLNSIGAELAEEFDVRYLFSDFKKKNGYKRSCELSELYSLYRQDYCGCEFSKKAAEKRKNNDI